MSPDNEPISVILQRLADEPRVEPWTLGEILVRLDSQGVHALKILLSLPFLFPVPIPGISTAFGFAIAFLALQEVTNGRLAMPKRLTETKIDAERLRTLLSKAVRRLQKVEKLFRRRWSPLCGGKAIFAAVAVTIISAGILSIPIPPVIPFTNTMPAATIILVALGCMWRDGVLVVLGYAMLVATIGYFWLIGDTVVRYLPALGPVLGLG